MDHDTSYVKIYNQVYLGASDNVRSKDSYELLTKDLGIRVKNYYGGYRIFKSNVNRDNLELRHQDMTYFGVWTQYTENSG